LQLRDTINDSWNIIYMHKDHNKNNKLKNIHWHDHVIKWFTNKNVCNGLQKLNKCILDITDNLYCLYNVLHIYKGPYIY